MIIQSRRKKSIALVIMIVFFFGLTGCGESVIPEMTKDEMQKVGEYAAITLMKYDANHRSRLVDLQEENVSEQKPETIPEPVTEPSGTDSVDDTPITDLTGDVSDSYDTMEEALGLMQGINVVYEGIVISDRYPTEEEIGSFYVPAVSGSKIIALKFTITNKTDAEQTIDIRSKGLLFDTILNKKYKKTSLAPVLPNDLSDFKAILKAGESTETILLFQMEEEKADSAENVLLKIKDDTKIYTIILQ